MAVLFCIFILPLLICIPFKPLHRAALRINCVWAWVFFRIAGIPIHIDRRFKLEPNQQYILCANHFSYLDIPALGLFPKPFKFVGKSQLSAIPLFGIMYNSLHITVDRASYRSRAQSLEKAREAIELGFNLGFFPEGGIRLTDFPNMVNFHDGAFRVAAENNLPVIPVTLVDNYNILRDDAVFEIRRRKCRIVYHEPIFAQSSNEEDIKTLRQTVNQVIQQELNVHFPTKASKKSVA